MYNYLTFGIDEPDKLSDYEYKNTKPETPYTTLALNMDMTESDYENINRLYKSIFISERKHENKANNILLSQDIYLSVFKHMYRTTNGYIIYDYFDDIPITLIRDDKLVNFIKILHNDNEYEFIEYLRIWGK